MNVLDLKKELPLSEAYEFRDDGKYLIAVSVEHFSSQTRKRLGDMVPANAVVVAVDGDPKDAVSVLQAKIEASSFGEATLALMGQRWTPEQAAELHELISQGTEPEVANG